MSDINSVEQYWQQRSQKYGRRAVLDLRHTDETYDIVSREQWNLILPHLVGQLNGSEKLAIDYGCGPGRLTGYLAGAIHGTAIGLDPTRALLDLAPVSENRSANALPNTSPNTRFEQLIHSRCTLPDQCADVAFVCLVLGGLRDQSLADAIAEINRLLRPGGLLFLIESTSDHPDPPHWTYRQVPAYQEMFPSIQLKHLSDYKSLNERIAMMAGR